MSIRLMSLVWEIRWPTQNHLLVALKLADYANDDGGKVWPAVNTIADQAQCSERTVQNVLKAFRDCGLVSVVKAGGGSMPTIYNLNIKMLRALTGHKLTGSADTIEIPEEIYAQVAPETGATIAPHEIAPVQPDAGRGANEGGRGATALHPNHHLEPSRDSPLRAHAREGSISDFKSERDRKAWLKIMSDRIKWAMDGPSLTRTWNEVKLVEAELGPEAFGLLKEAANQRLAELKARDDQRREAGERRFP